MEPPRLLILPMDVGNAESVWIARAYHCSNEVRDPHEKRASAPRFVRGAPDINQLSHHRRGVKAAGRQARVLPAAETQAEPCFESSQVAAALAARFDSVPGAPQAASAPRAPEHPPFMA